MLPVPSSWAPLLRHRLSVSASDPSTTITQLKADAVLVPNLTVRVLQPNGNEQRAALGLQPLRIGTAAECHAIVRDPKVSRLHLELRLTQRGIILEDLQSKNGTFVGPLQVFKCYIGTGVWMTFGDCRLVVEVAGPSSEVILSSSLRFGGALGTSIVMRRLFATLEHAAKFNSPILLVGEQGTGKRTFAEAVHRASPWAAGPCVALDVESTPQEALEVELFGYAPGVRADLPDGCAGALERSHGGTLYIAGPAAIPFPLQQKLVAALNACSCRRVGASAGARFDLRLITGTRTSLDPLVVTGELDEGLFRWMSVVPVEIPALRERKEDLSLLVEHFLAARIPPLSLGDLPPETMELFEGHTWPRNIDELKSLVERLAVYPEISRDVLASMLKEAPRASDDPSIRPLLRMTLEEAHNIVDERFMRLYLAAQLEAHDGNVSRAAKAMNVHRVYLHRLLKRYGIRKVDE